MKVVGDWTAVVQFRHPNEIGGVYFVDSFLVTIAIGIGVANGYENMVNNFGVEGTLTKEIVMMAMATRCIGTIG